MKGLIWVVAANRGQQDPHFQNNLEYLFSKLYSFIPHYYLCFVAPLLVSIDPELDADVFFIQLEFSLYVQPRQSHAHTAFRICHAGRSNLNWQWMSLFHHPDYKFVLPTSAMWRSMRSAFFCALFDRSQSQAKFDERNPSEVIRLH